MHYRNKRESAVYLRQIRKDYKKYHESYFDSQWYFYEELPRPEFVGTYVYLTLIPSLTSANPGLQEVIETLSERYFFRTLDKNDRSFTYDKLASNRCHLCWYHDCSYEENMKKHFDYVEKATCYVLKPEYWGQDVLYRRYESPDWLSNSTKNMYMISETSASFYKLNFDKILLAGSISEWEYNKLSDEAKAYFKRKDREEFKYGTWKTIVSYEPKQSIPRAYCKVAYSYYEYKYKKIIDGTGDSQYEWFNNHWIYGSMDKFMHWNNKRDQLV